MDRRDEALRIAEEILLSNDQEAIEALKAAIESAEKK